MKIINLASILSILFLIGCGDSGNKQDNITSFETSTNITTVNGVTQKSSVEIKVKDNVLYYTGDIDEHSNIVFESTIANIDASSLVKIVINSSGGDTANSRKIGRFVFDNKLDVEIDTMCAGSCANYVFTAGKNKIINKDALVVWAGNEHQPFIIAKIENKSVKEVEEDFFRAALSLISNNLPKEELDAIIKEQIVIQKQSMRDEKEFYKHIGVNLYISVLGLNKSYKEQKNGFSYSIEDMKKFNVGDVTYLGDGDYKESIPNSTVLYKVVEDIDALEEFDYSLLD